MKAENLKPGMIIEYLSGNLKGMVCKVISLEDEGVWDEVISNPTIGYRVGEKTKGPFQFLNKVGFKVISPIKDHLPDWL